MSSEEYPKTALVLAGGRGERLRPLTNDRPKPMVELAGAPILVHHLRWLRSNGIERAILLTGHLHEVIHDYFAVPRVQGLTVDCVAESHPLGRGGAFKHGFMQAEVSESLVVATNGDVITDQPIAEMYELHQHSGALVTLLLAAMVSPYPIVDAEDGLVRRFLDKPVLPYWMNAGIYLVDSSVFAQFPDEGDHETSTFPALANQGLMAGLKSHAYSKSVESAADLEIIGGLMQAPGGLSGAGSSR